MNQRVNLLACIVNVVTGLKYSDFKSNINVLTILSCLLFHPL